MRGRGADFQVGATIPVTDEMRLAARTLSRVKARVKFSFLTKAPAELPDVRLFTTAQRKALPHGISEAELSLKPCLLYTSPSPRDRTRSRMPSSA